MINTVLMIFDFVNTSLYYDKKSAIWKWIWFVVGPPSWIFETIFFQYQEEFNQITLTLTRNNLAWRQNGSLYHLYLEEILQRSFFSKNVTKTSTHIISKLNHFKNSKVKWTEWHRFLACNQQKMFEKRKVIKILI